MSTLHRMPSAPKCNFFLVGAPKAGTTSLHRLLQAHPDVFLSPIKEPCHFCTDVSEQLAPAFRKKSRIDLEAYLASPVRRHVGLAWVTSPSDYARLFEDSGGRRIVGECSTLYLSSKVAADRIHAYNPAARIVAILRRPIDRIRSAYEMHRMQGITRRPLLALVEEELRLGDEAHWGNCAFYVGASRYALQLKRFRDRFGDDGVCVLSFERLLADPATELATLSAFLGIEAIPPALPWANRKRAARFPAFNSALYASGIKPRVSAALRSLLPQAMEAAAKSVYYRHGAQVVGERELAEVESLLHGVGMFNDAPPAEMAWTGLSRSA